MVNYYEILGLSDGASIADIKASFRQLAKIYHPDINSEGIDHFAKILKAYETLSDPASKQSYDYKLQYRQTQSEFKANRQKTKSWDFDEKELKRRQYYNDHIKKYAKQTNSATTQSENKVGYNEFKYILFATPIAVILFLIIVHLANYNNPSSIQTSGLQAIPEVSTAKLRLGDNPYASTFGKASYTLKEGRSLMIKNLSGNDLVICLFTKETFVRSFFIESNYSAEVPQLPNEPLYISYSSGQNFDQHLNIKDVNVLGAFREKQTFYKSIHPTKLSSTNELTLTKNLNEGFEKINAQEFFERVKH